MFSPVDPIFLGSSDPSSSALQDRAALSKVAVLTSKCYYCLGGTYVFSVVAA